MKGISMKDLQTKRNQLVTDIEDLTCLERDNDATFISSTSNKLRYRAEIVYAKKKLATIDELLGECKELSEDIVPGRDGQGNPVR